MWTKEQIWQFLMLAGSVVFIILTILLTFKFGLIILFINSPVAIIGYFVHRMFVRTLVATRSQALQSQRHVQELSHYIAEQERISQELEKSEEKFRNAFDHAAVGMALVALSGQLLKVNRSFCDVLGFAETELLRMNFQSLVHKDDRYAFNVSLAKLSEGNSQKSQMEERVRHKQGHTIWLLRDSSLVKDAASEDSHFILQLQNITDRKRAEERINHDALHDALTDLPNRTLFMERLRGVLKLASRYPDNRFAVLSIDIDRFKRINDSLGHQIGDELLAVIAQRLESGARSGDVVARFGGDEFVMLVNDLSGIGEAVQLAERCQQLLSKPFAINNQDIIVTMSIGIAMWTREYENPDNLLRDADTALYQAKRLGRARTEIFNPAMHKREHGLLETETDLRLALERDELFLHYQPIIKLATNELVGVEALVRWQHPTRGLIPPSDFIALAEETGLIEPLGLWVLREACRQLRAWQSVESNLDLWMSVNVSSKQFMQSGLAAQVADILSDTKLAARFLKLEITESAIMENIDVALKVMKQLKESNVKLCVDDFGTGYSSLNYLHRLPLDCLKIDCSFV